MTNKTLKIYISTHFDESLEINNDLYNTINVKKLYPTLNRIFSEYCTMHYVYQNKMFSDFIGFCTYRRKIMEFQINPIKNSIQYFYKKHESFPTDVAELSFFKNWCNMLYFSSEVYNDILHYLKNQQYISYDKIKKCCNDNNTEFYYREMFITDYNLFEKLVKFIDDYIFYIKDKYKINSDEDWKNHIINAFILRHRKYYFEILKHNNYSHHLLYQSKKDFMNIFNDDYGFASSICNSWRAYSYIIEILISLFIYVHNHHETTLNTDNETKIFRLFQSQYEKIYNLLKLNKPKNICEFGSGDSTILFKKYCDKYNANLVSIEHNNGDFNLIDHTSINIKNTLYNDINKYEGLENYLTSLNKKFDFVLIDGPYAFESYLKYGRIQMLDFVEYNLLEDKGIFIIHDSERESTKKTIKLFLKKLLNKNYKYIILYDNQNNIKEMMVIQFFK